MNPEFPLYIVSKGRWDIRQTVKTLERMEVPFYIIIEGEEYDKYAKVIHSDKILVPPQKYKDEYDTCDLLGDQKSKGPGSARNFAWDHSIECGFDWHWVMDDNICNFYRINRNKYIVCADGTPFKVMEDFCLRYTSVAMAGPNYFMFVPRKSKVPPFTLNTRIYSCNLIRNDTPYRWRGRYNEDTDLSLRMLKDGWCTIQFNAFTQHKAPTQTVKGGNTEQFYNKEGTLPKSKMQVLLHPDVSKLVWRFNRWHHLVNYKPFKKNALVKRTDVEIKKGVDNYGMKLIKVKEN